MEPTTIITLNGFVRLFQLERYDRADQIRMAREAGWTVSGAGTRDGSPKLTRTAPLSPITRLLYGRLR